MPLTFTPPQPADLPRIMQIENAGFTPAEAASEGAMAERIATIADSFIVARDAQSQVVGYIVGPVVGVRYITDDLFAKTVPNPATGGVQTVLSLAVAPEMQGKGIAGKLVEQLIQGCRQAQREAISLTCLENLVPFYEKHGFKNEGVSASAHAGEVWYNLVLELN